MGEIAELMLGGVLCEGCGCELDGEEPGHPRRCPSCGAESKAVANAGAKKPGKAERARAKAKRGDPLPAWKLESPLLVTVRYHCTRCIRHFATEDGAIDHLRDVHGVTL